MIGYGDDGDYQGLDVFERAEAAGVELDARLADLEELIAELDAEFCQVARD